jgi:glycosyltransferase involved in cell wall biosynthesis
MNFLKDFYILYSDFDILFYKLYYNELNFNNSYEYYKHYYEFGYKNNYISSFNKYINLYNIDIDFIKVFYNNLNIKNNFDILNLLKNNINEYIISDNDFNNKFPDFDIDIYKLFHSELNDISLKSYWFHIGRYNNEISSINDFINNNIIKDITLYNFIYNNNTSDKINKNDILYWYNNKNSIIDTYDKLKNILIDIDIPLLIKNYPVMKKFIKEDIIKFYSINILKVNYIYSENIFKLKYPNLNLLEYKMNNKLTINNNLDIYNHYHNNKSIPKYSNIQNIMNLSKQSVDKELFCEEYNSKVNIIQNNLDSNYEILYNNFSKEYPYFDLNIYKLLNNLDNYYDNEIISHYLNIGLPLNKICNISMLNDDNIDFNLNIYRELNRDLKYLNDIDLFLYWYREKNCNVGNLMKENKDRIYSIKTFFIKYPQLKDKIEMNEKSIIDWMTKDIYNSNGDKYVGRREVNNIYEVLIDLDEKNKIPKNKLKSGISLIIRAKNEELNIKDCIESVVDLVDEIIFVDNNSTDNTYKIVNNYTKTYNNIKLYKYNIHVSKVGHEHSEAIKNKNPNTLGNFYNWALSKSTYSNIFKWDADFICIKNNFKSLVNLYNLKNKNDKFAIWFTGITLFENGGSYYFNPNSYYNEYRIFSYRNNFSWYDGDICEYTDPYLNSCPLNKKYIFEYPLFYEIKRTSIDEFKERSSMIDTRDINDNKILNNLKNNKSNNLIKFSDQLIYNPLNIYIYTPSLTYGGGNQFIINIYKFYKYLGFNIKIIPGKNEIDIKKFNSILDNDIININIFKDLFFSKKSEDKFNIDYIIFNSDIPFNEYDIKNMYKLIKIIFVTHSDVAYSNYFVEKYNEYFYKIITVNNYTIDKLSNKLNIDSKKFIKLINYIDNSEFITKKKTFDKKNIFGVISRFSEDKNMPMLIISLVMVFRKYPHYKCYFIGTNNEYYDNYLKYLCKFYNIKTNVKFKGYISNTKKYYDMFDFIILPSVSEGCAFNIIETFVSGIPIVCSNVGGNHELVINNINGYMYNYNYIREYEQSVIYITNYNEHLSKIGYLINDNLDKNYIFCNNYNNLEVIVPFSLKCKDNNPTCNYCNILSDKMKTFHINSEKITNSIINMIETDKNKLIKMSNNNIDFINNNFNKIIYYNQLLELL